MSEMSFSELLAEARAKFESKEFGESVSLLEKATELSPGNAEAWRLLGFSAQADDQLEEAANAFQTAIGLSPDNADAYFGQGSTAARMGDFEKAINSLDEALRLRPNHSLARTTLIQSLLSRAKHLVDEHRDHDAETNFERAYKLDRKSADTIVPYVEFLVHVGQHKKALEIGGEAYQANPGDGRLEALHRRIETDPALEHARRLARVSPAKPQKTAAVSQNESHEVPCPCGATIVMKWATVCPTCNQKIGDAKGDFRSQADRIKGDWKDTAYIVLSWVMIAYGVALWVYSFVMSEDSVFELKLFNQISGTINVLIGIALLREIEWVQFVGKLFLWFSILISIRNGFLAFTNEEQINGLINLIAMAYAGFFIWIISQVAD